MIKYEINYNITFENNHLELVYGCIQFLNMKTLSTILLHDFNVLRVALKIVQKMLKFIVVFKV